MLRRLARSLLLVVPLAAALARADAPPAGLEAISADRAHASVELLASDALEGRGSGAEGGRRAGEWLAEQLAALGLAPAGADGTFFQPFEGQGQRMRNVLATIPGDGTTDEVVIVGAHYDHLGLGLQEGSLDLFSGRGKVHNGADDNASGTAAVLEVARAFVAARVAPHRRVVFCWFDGEERGLLGSAHLAAHPCFQGRVALVVNLDMVGRLKGRPLTVYGVNTGDERLAAWARAGAAAAGVTLDLREAMPDNSDHASWYHADVPVFVPFTGLHADYHRPSDDTPRIDAEGIAKVARLAFSVACDAASDAGPALAFHKAKDGTGEAVLEQLQAMLGVDPDSGLGKLLERLGRDGLGGLGRGRDRDRSAAPSSGREPPRLGVRLDGGAAGPGVVVTSVDAGTIAEHAGVRAGDRIVRFDGQDVTDAASLRALIAQARGVCALEVVRGEDGARLELIAPFPGVKPAPAPPPADPDGHRWF